MVRLPEDTTKLIRKLTPKPGNSETYHFTLPSIDVSEHKGLSNMFVDTQEADYRVTIYHPEGANKEIQINFTKEGGDPKSLAPNYNLLSVLGFESGALMAHDMFYIQSSPHLTEMHLAEYQYCRDIDTSIDPQKHSEESGIKRIVDLSTSATPRNFDSPHILQGEQPNPRHEARALKAFAKDPNSEIADAHRQRLDSNRALLLEERSELLGIMVEQLHTQVAQERSR